MKNHLKFLLRFFTSPHLRQILYPALIYVALGGFLYEIGYEHGVSGVEKDFQSAEKFILKNCLTPTTPMISIPLVPAMGNH